MVWDSLLAVAATCWWAGGTVSELVHHLNYELVQCCSTPVLYRVGIDTLLYSVWLPGVTSLYASVYSIGVSVCTCYKHVHTPGLRGEKVCRPA